MMKKLVGKCLATLMAVAIMFAAVPISAVYAQEPGDSTITTTADGGATPEAPAEENALDEATSVSDESTTAPEEEVYTDIEDASAPESIAPEVAAVDTESVTPAADDAPAATVPESAEGSGIQAEEAGALPQEGTAEPQAVSGSGYKEVGSENLNNPANFFRDVLTMPINGTLQGGYNGAQPVDELYELWHDLSLSLTNSDKSSVTPAKLSARLIQSTVGNLRTDIRTSLEGVSHGVWQTDYFYNNVQFFNAEQLKNASSMAFFTYDLTSGYAHQQVLTTTIFYDFELIALQDDAAGTAIGNGIVTALSESVQPSKSYSNVTENRGPSGTVQGSQTVGTSATASVSKSDSNTREYSFAQSMGSETTVKAEAPFGLGGVEQTFSMSFTAEELFSTTVGQEIASSKGSEHSSTVATDCPPHTVAVMMTESFDGVNTVTYTYPVGIRFKVQTVGIILNYEEVGFIKTYKFGGIYRWNFSQSGTAGGTGNALDSLIDRYNNPNKDDGYEEQYKGASDDSISQVDWGRNVKRNSYGTLVNLLSQNRPYNSAGGSLSVDTEGSSSAVYKYAIYPLQQVRALAPFDDDYTMSGSALYVDGIGLQGFNAQSVPYYGFTRESGHWVLLDADGNDITANGNGVAKLKTNPVSGRRYLEAGSTAGHIYLKYLIDEDCYNHYNNGTGLSTFATNASLTSTAVVRVNVTGPAEDPDKLDPASPDSDKAEADKTTLGEDVVKGTNNDLGNVINNLSLPATGTNGSIIIWQSSHPDVVSADGMVTRPAAGQPDVTVELTATITNGSAIQTVSFTLTVKAQTDASKPDDSSKPDDFGKPDDSSQPTDPEAPTITGLKLAQTSLRLTKGKSATIGAMVYYSDGTSNREGLTWESSNPKVATVNQNGKVTAKSIANTDTATITATAENGASAQVKVTVLAKNAKAVKVTKVTLSGAKKTLDIGKTLQLKAKVSPSKATNAAVTWKSSKPSVLRVDAVGKITALKEGTAKITVKAGSEKRSVTIKVTAPVKSIKVDKKSVSLAKKGKTVIVTPTVTYSAEGYTAKLSWKSSDTKVATVKNGKITAKGKGKATITVSAANGKKATVKVTVKK